MPRRPAVADTPSGSPAAAAVTRVIPAHLTVLAIRPLTSPLAGQEEDQAPGATARRIHP
jgi:hypothetical protein